MTKHHDEHTISMEQVHESIDWDGRRQELLTLRHNLRKAFYVEVQVWGLPCTIYRADAPKVFADIDAMFETEIAAIDAKFQELGIRPTPWEAPAEESDEPEGCA